MKIALDNKKDEHFVDSLILFITDAFFGRINNLNEEKTLELFNRFRELLNKEEKKNPDKKALVNNMYKIIDAYYELAQKPEIIKLVKSKSITKQEFITLYKGKITGERESKFNDSDLKRQQKEVKNKRKYDMNDLYNFDTRNLIKKDTIRFVPAKEEISHIYYDICNRAIEIILLGELYFKDINNIGMNVSKYKIKKQMPNGTFNEFEVYSHINIFEMINEQYRDAVLNELLSDNNIMLSNCKGYIGEIVKKFRRDNSNNLETQNKEGYEYIISEQYSLEYKTIELIAVIENCIENSKSDKNLLRLDDYRKSER